MITADEIYEMICDFENDRPRSLQTDLGPSDLSSPCSRRLGYQLLGIDPVAPGQVSLPAFVGSAIHERMEKVLAHRNAKSGRVVWESEIKCEIPVGDTAIPCHVDAYEAERHILLDWKTTGPSAHDKYRRATPDNYNAQVDLYGLALVLSGRRVDRVGICYLQRNPSKGKEPIHVDTRPWDQDRAEASIRRYESLLTATGAGPQVLAMLPTSDDCQFCSHWLPGWPGDPTEACPGAQATQTTGTTPAETQPNPT